jgi:protein-S-isoprenylcysteine O-methyltransferase Ste14
MSDNITFIVRFILFAVVHSLLATARAKKLLHGTDHRWYRLGYNGVSVVMIVWVMAAGSGNVLYVAPGVLSLVMYAMQLVVAVILLICLRQTGIGEFLGFATHTSGSFTDSGWYGMVRHPLYFFSVLFMVLNPVMTSQWLLLIIMSTVYFIIGAVIEEKRLTAEYGDAYRRYRQRVPFLIPRFTRRLP